MKYIWVLFFILMGVKSLLIWNSILNLTLYFNKLVGNESVFTYFGFGYSFGGLAAFLITPLVFKKVKDYNLIFWCVIANLICFYSVMLLVETEFN